MANNVSKITEMYMQWYANFAKKNGKTWFNTEQQNVAQIDNFDRTMDHVYLNNDVIKEECPQSA